MFECGFDEVLEVVAEVQTVLSVRFVEDFEDAVLLLVFETWIVSNRASLPILLNNIKTVGIIPLGSITFNNLLQFALAYLLLILADGALLHIVIESVGFLPLHLQHIGVDELIFKHKHVVG